MFGLYENSLFDCFNFPMNQKLLKKIKSFLKTNKTTETKKYKNKTKDLCAENYKIVIKRIEDDSNKWKDSPCTGLELILLKWIPSETIYRFNKISIRLPMTFFMEPE